MPAAKTVPQQLLPGIQVLRGLAALAVAFHHTLEESLAARVGAQSPDWLTTAGAAGVDVFFVISGFIMLTITFGSGRPAIHPVTFLVKRAQRIYPLYWACCAVFILAGSLGFLNSQDFSLSVLLPSIFLLPSEPMLLGVAWTLVYEMIFYGLFALTLTLHHRSAKASAVGTTIAILAMMALARTVPGSVVANFLANPIVIEFCFGLAIALWAMGSKRPVSVPPGSAVAALAVIVTAPLFVAHDSTAGLSGFARVAAWGIPATIIVAASLKAPPQHGRLVGLGVLLGDASYAIYLTHAFVMIGYAKLLKTTALGDIPQVTVVPVVLALCAVVGIATHLIVEPRLQQIVNRASPSRKRSPEATSRPGA